MSAEVLWRMRGAEPRVEMLFVESGAWRWVGEMVMASVVLMDGYGKGGEIGSRGVGDI